MQKMQVWRLGALLGALMSCAVHAAARAEGALPEGRRAMSLISATGERQSIGFVTFAGEGAARTFTVAIEAPEFQVEFLSMRNFNCMRGEKETWCHIPYPYQTASRITADDLVDLEYALIFLWKPPTAFGIDTWNGIYFKLALEADGRIAGTVHDVNLGPLGVPPADPTVRPILPDDVTPAKAEAHRFSRLEIR